MMPVPTSPAVASAGRAIREGNAVRRPGPWTPTIHALLDHLHAVCLTTVPRGALTYSRLQPATQRVWLAVAAAVARGM